MISEKYKSQIDYDKIQNYSDKELVYEIEKLKTELKLKEANYK
jgi:hypothetical protein